MAYFSYTDTRYFRKKYLRPLIDEGKLLSFNSDKPTDPNQNTLQKNKKAAVGDEVDPKSWTKNLN